MAQKIRIYGYDGDLKTLQQDLTVGVQITQIRLTGKGIEVEFEPQDKGGRPARYDKDQIRQLRSSGLSYGQISKEIGCSPAYVAQVCKKEVK